MSARSVWRAGRIIPSGLVMPSYPGIFHSFYAVELIRGVGHACEVHHMDLVFHITNGFNPINTNNVGGVIFADVIENRKQVESALASGTPCVVINHKIDDMDVGYISVDNTLGGRIAADYLVSLGHKKVATITGNLTTQAGAQRLKGFEELLEEKNVPLPKGYVYQGRLFAALGPCRGGTILKLSNPPTAIFAASDEMALEAVAVILEKGLKVPEDISVIGFDDNPACLFGPVALTTIRQPLFQMAEDAVKYLHMIINGNSAAKKKTVLSPELIVRESCSSPKK